MTAGEIRYSGHWRKRRDTGGHELRRVRDREAPGSNPGPPTIFVFKLKRFPVLSGVDGAQAGHNFVENYRNLAVQ
jgi:hypothetical protein